MPTLIDAKGLGKRYGATAALNDVSLTVGSGRIVGIIGPNGAGKTTLLKAILGLIPVTGALSVLGMSPTADRDRLMQRAAFVADVALLPRWLRVGDAIDFVEAIHPRFRRERCDAFLAQAGISYNAQIKTLSKGTVTKVHLALVTAIDAELLVLDEPTLGLDILARRQFYDGLIGDVMDGERTLLITTHQVEEIEHLLTDLVFINHGRVLLDLSMEAVQARFHEVVIAPQHRSTALAHGPVGQREVLGRTVFLYDGGDASALAALGELRQPSVADLYVALISGGAQ